MVFIQGQSWPYAINSRFYITIMREKYVRMYEKFISHLWMHTNVKRVLLNNFLPISLLPPNKIAGNSERSQKGHSDFNPDYEIVIKRLHLYYNMKLVTYGINKERNLVVQFPVFIQLYIQQQLILYQTEMVPVPIIDQNKQAHSYTCLHVDRPYIALNSETYISLRHQELRMCKNIGYEFYCEELFVVKHKSKYSCESTIYFNLGSETIEEN